MAMNKKGFFFTLLSILFIAIFIVVFTSTPEITQRQYIEAGRIEANALDTFTKDFKYVFLENAMQASTRGALKAMIEYNEYAFDNFGDVGFGASLEDDFNLIMSESGLEEIVELIDLGAPGEDIEMILDFWGTPSLRMVFNDAVAPTQGFGGTQIVLQTIAFPNTTFPNWEDYHLETVTLFIKKQGTATNGSLVLSVYEAYNAIPTEHHLIARDVVIYEGLGDPDPRAINFTFPQLVELNPERNYSLVLAAPYVANGDYRIRVGGIMDYDCSSYGKECSAKLGTLGFVGDKIVWPLDYTLMENAMGQTSFVELIGSVNKLAKEYFHTRVELEYGDFEISQDGPWELEVSNSFNISNERTSSSIELSTDVDADVSIIGLMDPLQKINGIDIEIIAENETNETTIWTQALLEKHYTIHSFIINENAPDFLDRLGGDVSSSSDGISTLFAGDEFGVLGVLGPDYFHTIDYKYGFVECQAAPDDDQLLLLVGVLPVIYLDPDTALLYQIEDIPGLTTIDPGCPP